MRLAASRTSWRVSGLLRVTPRKRTRNRHLAQPKLVGNVFECDRHGVDTIKS